MLTPSASLREVDGGKWRYEMSCRCAFLYERAPDNKGWTVFNVACCNQKIGGEKHRRKQPEKKASLPKEEHIPENTSTERDRDTKGRFA